MEERERYDDARNLLSEVGWFQGRVVDSNLAAELDAWLSIYSDLELGAVIAELLGARMRRTRTFITGGWIAGGVTALRNSTAGSPDLRRARGGAGFDAVRAAHQVLDSRDASGPHRWSLRLVADGSVGLLHPNREGRLSFLG